MLHSFARVGCVYGNGYVCEIKGVDVCGLVVVGRLCEWEFRSRANTVSLQPLVFSLTPLSPSLKLAG